MVTGWLVFCVFLVCVFFFAYHIKPSWRKLQTSGQNPSKLKLLMYGEHSIDVLVKKGSRVSGGSLHSLVECDIEMACLD